MSLDKVRELLVSRLDESDRGDRGWFIITRLHIALSWLLGIADYLEKRSSGASMELNEQDYQRMATITEISAADPGLHLRRHHLLAMDQPLQLLRRTNGRSWREVELTRNGRALAFSQDPAKTLETVLSNISFANEPGYSQKRAEQYHEFNVKVYEATKSVLRQCEGYIDRNEFDFFVSRIRHIDEVDWAIDAIIQYRMLKPSEQDELHYEVRRRMPGDKEYANWRDVGLHIFSLFSLGTSMVRDGTCLRLVENWTTSRVKPAKTKITTTKPELRIPEPAESVDLLAPPSAPASNVGADAESFVAKVLRSQGWLVAFYTNRRGYGFDLWARKDNKAMLIEVKSSLKTLGTISLTETEYSAAKKHGSNYVLALVENIALDSPCVTFLQDPANKAKITKTSIQSYTITKGSWQKATH
ncbi:DUF3883 domain-containing protein [Vreelandella venusta]|uniref:protein NO VEIN domain-containing protein n=1 Tax=Vreelandella venusta TaxID=44935 RepID=UPI00384C8195